MHGMEQPSETFGEKDLNNSPADTQKVKSQPQTNPVSHHDGYVGAGTCRQKFGSMESKFQKQLCRWDGLN